MFKNRPQNPWPSFQKPTLATLLKSLVPPSVPVPADLHEDSDGLVRDVIKSSISKDSQSLLDKDIVSLVNSPIGKNVRTMWLGHASVFLQVPTPDITEDARQSDGWVRADRLRSRSQSKIFLESTSASSRMTIVSRDPSDETDQEDDHLDVDTLAELEKSQPGFIRYCVPSGVGRILQRAGIPSHRIIEMGWWQELEIDLLQKSIPHGPAKPLASPTSTISTLVGSSSLKVSCTPAQHNSGRSLFTPNKTLWSTWFLTFTLPEDDSFRCFFGGISIDARWADLSSLCRNKYGPPDLAFLPIAAGSLLPYIEKLFHVKLDHERLASAFHCSPKDAVEIHKDMRCRQSLGIHWGTFTTPAYGRRTLADLAATRSHGKVEGEWGAGHAFSTVEVGEWLIVDAGKKVDVMRLDHESSRLMT
ncbi:N-acyl-phosphatidylethanolamine-hydrolyzing phospholipase D, partial [Tremellales sp. Uapishka_1]